MLATGEGSFDFNQKRTETTILDLIEFRRDNPTGYTVYSRQQDDSNIMTYRRDFRKSTEVKNMDKKYSQSDRQ